MKLTTYLHLVPRSRVVELYLHSPIHPHGVVLIQLSIGTDFYRSLTWLPQRTHEVRRKQTFTHAPTDTLTFPRFYVCFEFCVLCIYALAFIRYEVHNSLSHITE
jgi:hypothetical protein